MFSHITCILVQFRIFKFPTDKNPQSVRYYLPQTHPAILILSPFCFWFILIYSKLLKKPREDLSLLFSKNSHLLSFTSLSKIPFRLTMQTLMMYTLKIMTRPTKGRSRWSGRCHRSLKWDLRLCFKWQLLGTKFPDERALRLSTFLWNEVYSTMASLREQSERNGEVENLSRGGNCPIMHPHFRGALSRVTSL